MPSRESVRKQLEEVRAAATRRGIGATPLVLECRRVGDYGETRAPGIHYEDPVRRTGVCIVYEGENPPQELIAKFMPKDGSPGPLVIILGPEYIEPPPDEEPGIGAV